LKRFLNLLETKAVFTPEQLQRLKYQIIAFKFISRGMPIPAPVHQALAAMGKAKDGVPGNIIAQKVTEATFQHVKHPSASSTTIKSPGGLLLSCF
jgi:hypothetical protein